eukprot:GHRR01022338.1.p1 GENE.GHRR01022338.1~~GHRR01022338.1.p1  ORF type:complete len:426 (+),score=134.24 GHRR01022338.1:342-1619(+)
MDTFQVYVGRQHHLSVEVEGQQFELVMQGNQPDAGTAGQANQPLMQQALPMPKDMTGSALAEFDPWQWQRQHIALPEVTLAGPVEVVLSRMTDLSLFLPHSTDVPRARRMLLGPGAALTLRQLKGISLRKPIALPSLPRSYVAEVYAHVKLGEAEPGFENAPGMLYLAGELYRQATNASLGLAGGRSKHLLSFEIEPAGASVTITSARQPGDASPPRLKLKKQPDGTLEVSLRDTDAAAAVTAAAKAAAGPEGVAPCVVAPVAWAWPLPLVGVTDWVPYESLLRSILAAHPLNLQKGLQQGLALRLTKSSIKGVSLIHFDMELKAPAVEAWPPADGMINMELVEGGHDAIEVWEAVVEVKEKQDGSGGIDFVPMSVKRKHAYHSTLTLSPSALALALGEGNGSRPLGTESFDLGLARSAAGAGQQ